jgi:hypothetical protein
MIVESVPGAQLTLEGMSKQLRPKEYTEEEHKLACAELAKEVMDWKGNDGSYDEVLEDLIDVCNSRDNGYEMAKRLDNYHSWEVDPELVEILDGFDSELYGVHQQTIKNWVQNNDIQPDYKIKDLVKFTSYGENSKDHSFEGTITRINREYATYVIYVPEMGHVKMGEDSSGTTGIIIDYEKVTELITKG